MPLKLEWIWVLSMQELFQFMMIFQRIYSNLLKVSLRFEICLLHLDCMFNKSSDATEKLLEYAEKSKNTGTTEKVTAELDWRTKPVGERLTYSLVKGIVDYIDKDTEEARIAVS